MDKSSEGLRQVSLDEPIERDDIFYVNGKAQLVLPNMVGKTIYEASLKYFAHADNILTIYRQEYAVKICDSSRIKVHVDYSSTK